MLFFSPTTLSHTWSPPTPTREPFGSLLSTLIAVAFTVCITSSTFASTTVTAITIITTRRSIVCCFRIIGITLLGYY